MQNMISKYTYKGLTWVDLEAPTREELSHVLESKSENALHFIVGDNTLITSRKYTTPEIKNFAKNFEMNLALERPVQIDNIDLLFLEIINFFRTHAENSKYSEQLAQKHDEVSYLLEENDRLVRRYNKKIFYLKIIILVAIITIIYILWR